MNCGAPRRGFTLIELLTVCVIIGILAGIGAAGFKNAEERARNSGMITNTRTVFLAIENWKSEHKNLPSELTGQDHTTAIASDHLNPTGAEFPVPYVHGNFLPPSPWANAPQLGVEASCQNDTVGLKPQISCALQLIADPNCMPNRLFMTDGMYFDDGGEVLGSPPVLGSGPSLRKHYGLVFYAGNPDSARFVVFGVGKSKERARILAVRSNFE